MAEAFKCDACNKYYDYYSIPISNNNTFKVNTIKLIRYGASGTFSDEIEKDLCPECMRGILDILNKSKESIK